MKTILELYHLHNEFKFPDIRKRRIISFFKALIEYGKTEKDIIEFKQLYPDLYQSLIDNKLEKRNYIETRGFKAHFRVFNINDWLSDCCNFWVFNTDDSYCSDKSYYGSVTIVTIGKLVHNDRFPISGRIGIAEVKEFFIKGDLQKYSNKMKRYEIDKLITKHYDNRRINET
jgi:hypothetical protein